MAVINVRNVWPHGCGDVIRYDPICGICCHSFSSFLIFKRTTISIALQRSRLLYYICLTDSRRPLDSWRFRFDSNAIDTEKDHLRWLLFVSFSSLHDVHRRRCVWDGAISCPYLKCYYRPKFMLPRPVRDVGQWLASGRMLPIFVCYPYWHIMAQVKRNWHCATKYRHSGFQVFLIALKMISWWGSSEKNIPKMANTFLGDATHRLPFVVWSRFLQKKMIRFQNVEVWMIKTSAGYRVIWVVFTNCYRKTCW